MASGASGTSGICTASGVWRGKPSVPAFCLDQILSGKTGVRADGEGLAGRPSAFRRQFLGAKLDEQGLVPFTRSPP
ncbi:MAG: hypothetical protein IPH73_13085 [Rhodocyclales bacterium]|nr:hypothetical protein [Rhodocyclales bacterium]